MMTPFVGGWVMFCDSLESTAVKFLVSQLLIDTILAIFGG